MNELIASTRAALGSVGAFLPLAGIARLPPVDTQRDAVRRLERAGYRTAWTNEGVGGRDALVHAGVLLAATDRLVLGTSIASMWARAPEHLHAGAAQLAEAYPGRFVLGAGVGYAFQAERVGRSYQPARTQFAQYLARMRADDLQVHPPDVQYPVVIAANGPKMLDLARDGADGAQPTMVPPAFTKMARETLGPDKLLLVGLAVVVDDDADAARGVASQIVQGTMGFPGSPYRANLARLGYTDDELDSGAARVVADVIGCGGPDDVAAQAQRHLDAGADHVILTTITGDFETRIGVLERVAPAVTKLTKEEQAA
ncbi:MAG: LLM class flavin-dependent oxidoreductase [Ilumatobacteraceae bacterium]|jgi:probable F420-dependent oxidoreductase